MSCAIFLSRSRSGTVLRVLQLGTHGTLYRLGETDALPLRELSHEGVRFWVANVKCHWLSVYHSELSIWTR